jgi:chromosome partitioning protein
MEAFFAEGRERDVPWKQARVLWPPIRRNIKLAEAPSFGQSIFDYAPQAAGARDYAALAKHFVAMIDPASPAMMPAPAEAAAEAAEPENSGPEATEPDAPEIVTPPAQQQHAS